MCDRPVTLCSGEFCSEYFNRKITNFGIFTKVFSSTQKQPLTDAL